MTLESDEKTFIGLAPVEMSFHPRDLAKVRRTALQGRRRDRLMRRGLLALARGYLAEARVALTLLDVEAACEAFERAAALRNEAKRSKDE